MHVESERCEKFGLDEERVKSIARRISRAEKEAEALGLVVFGGIGRGSLRFQSALMKGTASEVADLDGCFDGGDGGDDYI